MKTKLLTVAVALLFSTSVFTQSEGKIQLGVEVPTKISIGNTSLQRFDYKGKLYYNAPWKAKYNNPVYGIDFSIMYAFCEYFKAGIGAGINGESFETHPFFEYDYYNRIMFPLYAKFRFQKNLGEKAMVLSDIHAGCLIADNRLDNDTFGFYFTSKGKLLAGMDIGCGYKLNKYWLYLKIGYELNVYDNTDRLDWGSFSFILAPEDKISYKTYYNTLRLSLGISL